MIVIKIIIGLVNAMQLEGNDGPQAKFSLCIILQVQLVPEKRREVAFKYYREL